METKSPVTQSWKKPVLFCPRMSRRLDRSGLKHRHQTKANDPSRHGTQLSVEYTHMYIYIYTCSQPSSSFSFPCNDKEVSKYGLHKACIMRNAFKISEKSFFFPFHIFKIHRWNIIWENYCNIVFQIKISESICIFEKLKSKYHG